MSSFPSLLEIESFYGTSHHRCFDLMIKQGEGAYVFDDQNKRYLDFNTAYSAVSLGHKNTRLINRMVEQANQLAMVCNAFHHPYLSGLLEKISKITGYEKGIIMNTGVEAVETAIKIARRYGYQTLGIQEGKARIAVMRHNFHGRTLATLSCSTNETYRDGFSPFLDGFDIIDWSDPKSLVENFHTTTCAILFEPIQGEGGVHLLPSSFLKGMQEEANRRGILLIADEIQSGLLRTGTFLACEHEGIRPDMAIFGKALGGGLVPVSAVIGRKSVMDVLTPGSHGSTFGGYPLGCAIAHEALCILEDPTFRANIDTCSELLMKGLKELKSPLIKEVRGRGLFIGMEVNTARMGAKDLALALIQEGLLVKETREKTIRLMPPLTIQKHEIQEALTILQRVLKS